MRSSMDAQPECDDETPPWKRARTADFMSKQASINGKQVQEEDGPACQECRKKKIKCSRQQPCTYCIQYDIECTYSTTKTKPGLRTGAVENLNQRLASLENMFLGQSVLWQQVWSKFAELEHDGLSRTEDSTPKRNSNTLNTDLETCKDNFKDALFECSQSISSDVATNPLDHSKIEEANARCKRRSFRPNLPAADAVEPLRDLPADHLLEQMIEVYFENIHPWIPILHVKRFKERFACEAERPTLEVILYAIVSVMVRFFDHEQFENPEVRQNYIQRSREKVILQSVESFSVENLQALIIIAFDTIGNGRGPSSWSIVGSMTRTVEQLQLNVEDENEHRQGRPSSVAFLIRRMSFLAPPSTWILEEEQRRVFWAVFLMDRFCSIATGWNLSLTSADVRRRLPCERALWEHGLPLEIPAPYFGTVDKGLQSSKDPYDLQSNMPLNPSATKNPASLGGFAYRIEATETLSLVTMFFLKYPVNVANVQDVQIWMMKFKELDLRLVQWKIFLPEKWREASVFTEYGVMDQNLSLAHIMHNTAVILLHQGIAYPCSQWRNSPIRLPSSSSAETCMAAAAEISNIAQHFLIYSPPTSIVAPDLAFCLFVTGRMLLAHAFHYNTALPIDFDRLMDSLNKISQRWDGRYSSEEGNLASKLAARLVQAREIGHVAAAENQPSLDLQHAVYSEKEHYHIARQRASGSENASPPQVANSSEANPDNYRGLLKGYGYNESVNAALSLAGLDAAQVQEQVLPSLDISLAFPALPFTSQVDWAAASTPLSRQSGKSPQYLQDSARDINRQILQDQDHDLVAEDDKYGNSRQEYDDLSLFFKSPYLPTQRISTLAGMQDTIRHE